jgi:hypothetical protein
VAGPRFSARAVLLCSIATQVGQIVYPFPSERHLAARCLSVCRPASLLFPGRRVLQATCGFGSLARLIPFFRAVLLNDSHGGRLASVAATLQTFSVPLLLPSHLPPFTNPRF